MDGIPRGPSSGTRRGKDIRDLHTGKFIQTVLILDDDCQVQAETGDMGEGVGWIVSERRQAGIDDLPEVLEHLLPLAGGQSGIVHQENAFFFQARLEPLFQNLGGLFI